MRNRKDGAFIRTMDSLTHGITTFIAGAILFIFSIAVIGSIIFN
jgi:hypothetical protein